MPWITCKDGTDLFFNTEGQGEPVVLIAGGFCDHHVWDEVVKFLSEHFQVIRYDNRGIGQSDVTKGPYTVELLAGDLDCLLTELEIPSAHIIGHSMGGFVAQYFAAHYGNKIRSLSLLSSLLVMNKSGKDYLNFMARGIQNNPTELRQSIQQEYRRLSSFMQKLYDCDLIDQ